MATIEIQTSDGAEVKHNGLSLADMRTRISELDVQIRASAAAVALLQNAAGAPGEQTEDVIRHDTPIDLLAAIVCHEANRMYAQSLGDTSHKPWSEAPGWQRASAIQGVRAIVEGRVTKAEDSHASWMAEKIATGWRYGPTKDQVAKTHPSLLPFGQLSASEQLKDSLFFNIASTLLGRRLSVEP